MSVDCGQCLLPLAPASRGLHNQLLHSPVATGRSRGSRQVYLVQSLTGVGLVGVQSALSAAQAFLLQPLFPLTLFCTAATLFRAGWQLSP